MKSDYLNGFAGFSIFSLFSCSFQIENANSKLED